MNWATLVVIEEFGQALMNEKGLYPPICEFYAIAAAAVEACDELDGVKDRIVFAYGQRHYEPLPFAARALTVTVQHKIPMAATEIANLFWEGPVTAAGTREWFGFPHQSPFNVPGFGVFGVFLNIVCPENSPTDAKKCKGAPFAAPDEHIRLFLRKDPGFDMSTLTQEYIFMLLHQSRQEWSSVLDTADPDLSVFKAAGGKMIHWHGIADQLIPVHGSANYFKRVEAMAPNARDFYRYFEVPGVTRPPQWARLGPDPRPNVQPVVGYGPNLQIPTQPIAH